jgi:hypothetical protein
MARTGGCACGAIRFEIKAPFIGIGACHCTDCQKASGGGPNYVGLVPKEALLVTRGEAKFFHAKADSGAEVARAFCPDCGTPLWSVPADLPFFPVKLGALDERADVAPQMHIYVASAPSWHPLDDGLPAFPRMPPAP